MTRPSAEVAIIGAGIIGAACALELSRRGVVADLIDARPPGTGVSSRCMGHLLALDESPELLTFSAASRGMWAELAETLPAQAQYSTHGTLWVARAGQGQSRDVGSSLQAKLDVLRAQALRCHILGADELRRCEPELHPDLAGAVCVPDDASVYPPAVARAWVARAQASGRVRLRCATVSSIEGARLVFESGEEAEYEQVVLACGHASAALLPSTYAAKLFCGRKGHLVITDDHAPRVRHQLLELGYAESARARQGVSVAFNVQPRATGQLLIGSSRGSDDCAGVDPAIVRRMLDRSIEFLPGLARARVLRVWTGVRPATQLHRPVIGAVPGLDPLWLATGHEGLGITCAPATASVLANAMTGRAPDSLDRLVATGFRPPAYVAADAAVGGLHG